MKSSEVSTTVVMAPSQDSLSPAATKPSLPEPPKRKDPDADKAEEKDTLKQRLQGVKSGPEEDKTADASPDEPDAKTNQGYDN